MTLYLPAEPPAAADRRDGDDSAPIVVADAVEIQTDRDGGNAGNGRSCDIRKISADRLLSGVAFDTALSSFSSSLRKTQKTPKAFADETRIKPRRQVGYRRRRWWRRQ